MSTAQSRRLLDAALPLDGMRVIELGCGSGELSELLADAAGADGQLITGDISEQAVLRTRARLAACPNATVVRFDADRMPCPSASADTVIAAMQLPRCSRGRPTRSPRSAGCCGRRRFLASVWGSAHANPWLTLAGATLARSGLRQVKSAGSPAGGGPFSLGSADALQSLIAEAGFVDVRVEQIDTTQSWPNHHAYLESMRAVLPSFGTAIDSGKPEQRARLVATIDAATHRFTVNDEIRMPLRWLLCTASID